MVRPERFELPASWFVARRSIQLSYGRNACDIVGKTSEGVRNPPIRLILRAGSLTHRRREARPMTSLGAVRLALRAALAGVIHLRRLYQH